MSQSSPKYMPIVNPSLEFVQWSQERNDREHNRRTCRYYAKCLGWSERCYARWRHRCRRIGHRFIIRKRTEEASWTAAQDGGGWSKRFNSRQRRCYAEAPKTDGKASKGGNKNGCHCGGCAMPARKLPETHRRPRLGYGGFVLRTQSENFIKCKDSFRFFFAFSFVFCYLLPFSIHHLPFALTCRSLMASLAQNAELA